MRDDFDTFNFHEEVDETLDVEVDSEDAEIANYSADHAMSPLIHVLQTLGVDAADAANLYENLITDFL